ncbi:hypothetical protein BGZ96_005790, partial [Linnemannia gamsii]
PDMSKGKPKATWCYALRNLYTRAYFESCDSPQDFGYKDFLLWSKKQQMTKIKAQQEWSKDFFLERQSQRTFEKSRRKLHGLIDDVMNKRRRKDYASEKASLDKELQNDEDDVDEDSDDEDSDDEIDLRDGEEDLTSGYHTPPPKQVQRYYDEVPSVE